MWKRYVWPVFWTLGLLVAVARFIHHLQTDALKWRLAVDAIVIVLFTINYVTAWQKFKAAKNTAERT